MFLQLHFNHLASRLEVHAYIISHVIHYKAATHIFKNSTAGLELDNLDPTKNVRRRTSSSPQPRPVLATRILGT